MRIKDVLKDVKFWIILFFLIRMVGITNPPIETVHNWRQTTETMVARNFLEADPNILYPRIDIAGEKTGITGMEFPVLNYLMFLASKVFGYQHWYGRIINLVISSLGLWYFYQLSRKYFTEQISLYATLILAVSVWFQFSRKIMPDTFSMSLLIMGIYYGTNYLDLQNNKRRLLHLLLYFMLTTGAIMAKLPSAYLCVVFILYLGNKHISARKKWAFVLVSTFVVLPVGVWYFYWVPYLVENYGFWHFFMGKSFAEGAKDIIHDIPKALSQFYDTALKFIGFGAFVLGIAYSLIKREKLLLSVLSLSFFSFCVIILKSGNAFLKHNYYIVPFVPVMALISGYGLSQLKNTKIAVVILVAISVEGVANQFSDLTPKKEYWELVGLEADLDKVSKRDDLVIINSNEYPTPMYFAHRKGWVNSNERIQNPDYIKELASKGLKFIVILKKRFGTEIRLEPYKKVLENEAYCIYKVGD